MVRAHKHVGFERGVEIGQSSREAGDNAPPPPLISGTAACRVAAMEPRAALRAENVFPCRTRALATETTTLPASASDSSWAVDTTESHGVATTTTSAAAAVSLAAPTIVEVAPRPVAQQHDATPPLRMRAPRSQDPGNDTVMPVAAQSQRQTSPERGRFRPEFPRARHNPCTPLCASWNPRIDGGGKDHRGRGSGIVAAWDSSTANAYS